MIDEVQELRAALRALFRPYNPEESTAQPPYLCAHRTAHRNRNGLVCSLCGASAYNLPGNRARA